MLDKLNKKFLINIASLMLSFKVDTTWFKKVDAKMVDNIIGEVTIKWAEGAEQSILGNEFQLGESVSSEENSYDQLYISHVDHPENGEEGKIYLDTRVDINSENVSFSKPELEGRFEITEFSSLDVESRDYDDEDFDQD